MGCIHHKYQKGNNTRTIRNTINVKWIYNRLWGFNGNIFKIRTHTNTKLFFKNILTSFALLFYILVSFIIIQLIYFSSVTLFLFFNSSTIFSTFPLFIHFIFLFLQKCFWIFFFFRIFMIYLIQFFYCYAIPQSVHKLVLCSRLFRRLWFNLSAISFGFHWKIVYLFYLLFALHLLVILWARVYLFFIWIFFGLIYF